MNEAEARDVIRQLLIKSAGLRSGDDLAVSLISRALRVPSTAATTVMSVWMRERCSADFLLRTQEAWADYVERHEIEAHERNRAEVEEAMDWVRAEHALVMLERDGNEDGDYIREANGSDLDRIGNTWGLVRLPGELDATLRARILKTRRRP